MIVIMNPPYGSIGSQIVKTVTKMLPNAEKIILLPLQDILNCSKEFRYDSENTFNTFVKDEKEVTFLKGKGKGRSDLGKLFPDAAVINLFLWKSGNTQIDKEDLVWNYLMDVDVRPIYEAHTKLPKRYDLKTIKYDSYTFKEMRKEWYKPNRFLITDWNPNDGVHEGAAKDRFYNLRHLEGEATKDEWQWRVDRFKEFPTDNECQNFIKWVYFGNNGKPGLSDILYKSTGLMHYSELWWSIIFPNLDWSRSWTDEEILEELGLRGFKC